MAIRLRKNSFKRGHLLSRTCDDMLPLSCREISKAFLQEAHIGSSGVLSARPPSARDSTTRKAAMPNPILPNDTRTPIADICRDMAESAERAFQLQLQRLEAVLGLIAEALPGRLRETAYALAVEVAVADLHIWREEIRFLARLRDALELDKLVTAAIERSALARYHAT